MRSSAVPSLRQCRKASRATGEFVSSFTAVSDFEFHGVGWHRRFFRRPLPIINDNFGRSSVLLRNKRQAVCVRSEPLLLNCNDHLNNKQAIVILTSNSTCHPFSSRLLIRLLNDAHTQPSQNRIASPKPTSAPRTAPLRLRLVSKPKLAPTIVQETRTPTHQSGTATAGTGIAAYSPPVTATMSVTRAILRILYCGMRSSPSPISVTFKGVALPREGHVLQTSLCLFAFFVATYSVSPKAPLLHSTAPAE